MTIKIFIPRDAAALAVGADAVAKAIALEAQSRGLEVEITRTGTRGLLWLEPLVEVEVNGQRLGYGPVAPRDVKGLFEAGFVEEACSSEVVASGRLQSIRPSSREEHATLKRNDAAHPLAIGAVEQHAWFKRQQRLTFARCGVIDPFSLEHYRATGGLKGLEKAISLSGDEIVEAVTQSGLRGRGGAGFPTGIKWKTVLGAVAEQKYIVCNADEGDSGTFADRILMEGDPFTLIEGMAIAGLAVGATRGYIYIRSEYPHAFAAMERAISVARHAGVLGADVLGSGRTFELEARLGAGAYICGEETALLESLEGKRGVVRAKPPLPALQGLFGKPTVVNNVLSLAAVSFILAEGAKAYADYGMGRSRGTLPVQLAGNVKRGGLVELAFGISLREIIEDLGGGTRSGRPIRAVQVGGPLGAYIPAHQLDVPLDYEALAGIGAMLGHGGVVVFDDTVDMAKQAKFVFDFCAAESCGKCTPCRIGAVRGAETVARIINGEDRAANLALVESLCTVMRDGSLCAHGGLTPNPVMSALTHFPEDFNRPPVKAFSSEVAAGSHEDPKGCASENASKARIQAAE